MHVRSRVNWTLLPLGLAITLVASGCSLPLPGGGEHYHREILFGYVSVNEDSKCYRRIVAGLDIRANLDWGGVLLGWSDLRALNLVRGGSSGTKGKSSAPRFTLPFGIKYARGGRETRIGWTIGNWPASDPDCAFIHHVSFGLGARISTWSSGLNVGFDSHSIIYADPDLDGRYLLQYESRNPESGILKVTMKGDGE